MSACCRRQPARYGSSGQDDAESKVVPTESDRQIIATVIPARPGANAGGKAVPSVSLPITGEISTKPEKDSPAHPRNALQLQPAAGWHAAHCHACFLADAEKKHADQQYRHEEYNHHR